MTWLILTGAISGGTYVWGWFKGTHKKETVNKW